MGEIDEDLAAIVESRIGRSVCGGRYSIEQVIGIGGMAAVYAGSHRNGRPVALKFLHPDFSRRADIRKRFIREGQAANAVQHPSIVAVIDDDVAEDGSAFLVMERLEGKSLEQLWEALGRRFPTRAVLAIARDLCDVLAVAHRAGIYHRDLKPENLFLTNDGVLKVLDFGLAHLRDAARPKETHTGMVFGTPAFMPPEQASGQVSQIDARTDIWAVGATLFTLLSGELVHKGETAQHFVVLAAMEPARSLAAVTPHAHPSLVQIVDRALAREKEARWQTAESMREAICSAMDLLLGDHEGSLPTPIALLEMADRQKRRVALSPIGIGTSTVDEPTKPKAPAALIDDTLDDATRVDKVDLDSGPDTEPNAIRPISGGSSDTPTEERNLDEPPTQVRAPVDSAKRASWSDLRKAIADHPSSKKVAAAELLGETQLLSQTPPQDRTQLLGRDYRPSSAARVRPPAPSGPAFAIPHERASYAAPLPVPRAPRRAQETRKAKPPRKTYPYLPVIGASVLIGLSPLAYVVARDCGSASNEASIRSPREVAPVNVKLAPEPAATEVRRREPTTPVVEPPPPAPPPLPSTRDALDCTPPYTVDANGIKRVKARCFEGQ